MSHTKNCYLENLANGWMSQYDPIIRGDAKLFTRYMDDILREIKRVDAEHKLSEINALHPNLCFTIERETEGKLHFLGRELINSGPQISSTFQTNRHWSHPQFPCIGTPEI